MSQKPPSQPGALLTHNQMAAYLCVSRTTINRLLAERRLPPCIYVGERRRLLRKTVDAWLHGMEKDLERARMRAMR